MSKISTKFVGKKSLVQWDTGTLSHWWNFVNLKRHDMPTTSLLNLLVGAASWSTRIMIRFLSCMGNALKWWTFPIHEGQIRLPPHPYMLVSPIFWPIFWTPNSLLECFISKFQHKPSHMNAYYHPKLHNNKFLWFVNTTNFRNQFFYNHSFREMQLFLTKTMNLNFVYCYKAEEVSWVELKA